MSRTRDFTLREDSTLCIDCQGLCIDDKAAGGFMEVSEHGTPRLRFKKEKTMGLPAGALKLLTPQERTDTSPDFPKLANSAASGCGFCGFLRASLLMSKIQALQRQGEVSISLAYAWGLRSWGRSNEEGLQALVAQIRHAHNEEVATLHFSIFSSSDQSGATDWLGLHMGPRIETLCPENVSFLQHALESCTTVCHPPTTTSFLPTRLLDIGTDPAARPRLIITADFMSFQEPIRYAAVSYCWGSKADACTQTKTEPSNLHERLRAIPICDLSAVVQDSITVCKALSVRYLWVDALCIIQDPTDSSDWQRESERVGQVYQHAYFTICALAAHNCHQSFLSRSQHTFKFNFQSSLHPATRGEYILKFIDEHDRPWYPVHNPLSMDLDLSRWHNRGWVFQEENLSVRKLYLGQTMAHFECGSIQISENGEAFEQQGAPDWTNLDREKVYEWFRGAAQVYSARNLTFESDRLPALAGLAKNVSEFTGAKYLAGLWMEDLPFGLLWRRITKNKTLLEHLDSLQASSGSATPSWSWASRPGCIEHMVDSVHDFQPEYTEIDAWTTLKGAQLNRFGEVESGTIQIRGCRLLPVPADSVLSQRFKLFWCFRLRKGSSNKAPTVADCYPDWDGTSCTLPGRLRMLLLTSRCIYEDESEEDEEDDSEEVGEDDDREEAGVENGSEDGRNEGGEHDESEDENPTKKEVEDVTEKEDEADANRGRSSEAEMDHSVTVSDDGNLQGSYTDTKPNRHAYGLLIHPAEKIGEYYRVGVFESRAGKAGGTWLFKDLEDECIWIV